MPFDTRIPLQLNSIGEEINKNRLFKQRMESAAADAEYRRAAAERAAQPDFRRQVQEEVLKATRGQPFDQSIIDAASVINGQQSYIDPTTQAITMKPTLRDNLGNLLGKPQATPGYSPQPRRRMGSVMEGLPTDLQSIDNNYNAQGTQGTLPPPLPASSLPSISMDDLRGKAVPRVQVSGELANTPRGQLMEAEANLALDKEQAKADMNAGNSYKTESGKQQAKLDASKQAIVSNAQNVNYIFDQMDKLAGESPSGSISSGAANLSNKLGLPSQGAIAQGKYQTNFGQAVLELRKQMAGQGTITEGETKIIFDMLPAPEDSREVKKAKIQQAKDYYKQLIESKQNTQNPETPAAVDYQEYFK